MLLEEEAVGGAALAVVGRGWGARKGDTGRRGGWSDVRCCCPGVDAALLTGGTGGGEIRRFGWSPGDCELPYEDELEDEELDSRWGGWLYGK